MCPMPHAADLVDEVASELASWPGVHIERPSESVALVRYEHLELGVLDREHGVAELRFPEQQRHRQPVGDDVEHGDAEPSDAMPEGVSHAIHGPADITAVLGLFDRRYRDLRGEDDPYTSQDSA